MRTTDLVIAGAGIIGLSAALEFAVHGLSVTVFEQGEPMREASWAAAGMLAARDPENPSELLPLAELSRSLYPGFLQTIERLSGLRVPLRTHATLQRAHCAGGLSLDELRALVPDMIPGAHSFLRLEEDSLDPRDLCRALPLAARAAGVTLCEHTAVLAVCEAGDRLRVSTSDGDCTTRNYLHCGGAWSAVPPLGEDPLPVTPRKGQILVATMPAGAPVLEFVIRTPEVYLVPRGDRRIVIGATVEDAGFDREVTDAATEVLLSAAAALWPPILTGSVTERWTGLRPSTPDALPILSPIADSASYFYEPRQWVATGHFRNGILLAPGSARVLRQMVLGEPAEVDLHAFRAARFARVEAAS